MRRSVLALLTLSVAGCGITGLDSVALQFQGTVTAQATGQPVAGAQIKLYPSILDDVAATTTTDAQGNYSLSQSIEGCIEAELGLFLAASASGFDSQGLNAACRAGLQRIDFSLPPAPAP